MYYLICHEALKITDTQLLGKFTLTGFKSGDALTVTNTLRRALLSQLSGAAIVYAYIVGANHEYAPLKGIQQLPLDLLINLKQVILKSDIDQFQPQVVSLDIQGPAKIQAKHFAYPFFIHCVNPDHVIAYVNETGHLQLKIIIVAGQGTRKANLDQRRVLQLLRPGDPSGWKSGDTQPRLVSGVSLRDDPGRVSLQGDLEEVPSRPRPTLGQATGNQKHAPLKNQCFPVNSVFAPVKKVNYTILPDAKDGERACLEIWTNGSMDPKEAIHQASRSVIHLFLPFQDKSGGFYTDVGRKMDRHSVMDANHNAHRVSVQTFNPPSMAVRSSDVRPSDEAFALSFNPEAYPLHHAATGKEKINNTEAKTPSWNLNAGKKQPLVTEHAIYFLLPKPKPPLEHNIPLKLQTFMAWTKEKRQHYYAQFKQMLSRTRYQGFWWFHLTTVLWYISTHAGLADNWKRLYMKDFITIDNTRQQLQQQNPSKQGNQYQKSIYGLNYSSDHDISHLHLDVPTYKVLKQQNINTIGLIAFFMEIAEQHSAQTLDQATNIAVSKPLPVTVYNINHVAKALIHAFVTHQPNFRLTHHEAKNIVLSFYKSRPMGVQRLTLQQLIKIQQQNESSTDVGSAVKGPD